LLSIWIDQELMRSPPLAILASAGWNSGSKRPLAIRDRRRIERRAATSLGKCDHRNLVP
jgi:hypothetical protein